MLADYQSDLPGHAVGALCLIPFGTSWSPGAPGRPAGLTYLAAGSRLTGIDLTPGFDRVVIDSSSSPPDRGRG
jgi:hypothetical protein